ncbi:hypothetical protein HPULCUR_007315 [Helicostylum pulchrum]|uniref:Alpha/beta hydrolase fold-3 domain-containing protein n=1 Tax=Helicostylum pulchrum TaxID=562976 RepID=A0ABP9Y5J1_9FUNG
MDTFHPGVKTLVVSLLSAFVLTKHGRDAAAEIINKRIKLTLLFWLPIQVRCNIVKRLLSLAPKRADSALALATKPWGYQWDYITKVTKDTWYGNWIVPNSHKVNKKERLAWLEETSKEADLVLYYIHGGGFRAGNPTMYMESFIHIIDHIAKTRGMKTHIFSVEYAKIPDFKYFRAKEDCINGYRYLVQDLGIDPKKIVVAGDSAGGNLVASCLLSIRDMKLSSLPLPAGNVQISPWVTIVNDDSSRADKVYVDCLDHAMLNSYHGDYFLEKGSFANREEEKAQLRNPNISPLFGSFVGFCPTLITYGGTEVLQHDVQELIGCLERDQVKVDVIMRPEAPHIWLISSILSPTHEMWRTDCSRLADWCANCVAQ